MKLRSVRKIKNYNPLIKAVKKKKQISLFLLFVSKWKPIQFQLPLFPSLSFMTCVVINNREQSPRCHLPDCLTQSHFPSDPFLKCQKASSHLCVCMCVCFTEMREALCSELMINFLTPSYIVKRKRSNVTEHTQIYTRMHNTHKGALIVILAICR